MREILLQDILEILAISRPLNQPDLQEYMVKVYESSGLGRTVEKEEGREKD